LGWLSAPPIRLRRTRSARSDDRCERAAAKAFPQDFDQARDQIRERLQPDRYRFLHCLSRAHANHIEPHAWRGSLSREPRADTVSRTAQWTRQPSNDLRGLMQIVSDRPRRRRRRHLSWITPL